MYLQNLRVKLRYVLWPFLRLWVLLNAAVGLGSAMLAWWQPPLQDWPAGALNFWLPLLLAAVVVFPGLWSSFGLIRNTRSSRGLLPLLAVGTLATAASNLSAYVAARLAPACHLPELPELGRHAPARYYLAAHARLDSAAWRSQSGIYTTSGKHRHAVFYLAIACPVAAPAADSARPAPAWVGFYYQHDTTALRVAATSASNQHFLAQSQQAFRRDAARPATYFERWPADRAGTAVRASLGPPASVGNSAIVLQPVYSSFAKRGSSSLTLWAMTQATGVGLFSLLLLLLPLAKTQTARLLFPAAPSPTQPLSP